MVSSRHKRLYERFSRYSYAFMRFAAGAVLVPHGIQKIVNNSGAGLSKAIAAHGLPFSAGARLFRLQRMDQVKADEEKYLR